MWELKFIHVSKKCPRGLLHRHTPWSPWNTPEDTDKTILFQTATQQDKARTVCKLFGKSCRKSTFWTISLHKWSVIRNFVVFIVFWNNRLTNQQVSEDWWYTTMRDIIISIFHIHDCMWSKYRYYTHGFIGLKYRYLTCMTVTLRWDYGHQICSIFAVTHVSSS